MDSRFILDAAAFLAVAAAGFAGMEAIAWASHKYLMHGPLWVLHRSHHAPRKGGLEANDAFGIFFSLPSILLIVLGLGGRPLLIAAGLGMTAYGAAYLIIHDSIAHARFGRVRPPRNAYLAKLVAAHRIHHANAEKRGGANFGFMWAPPRVFSRPSSRPPPRTQSPGPSPGPG